MGRRLDDLAPERLAAAIEAAHVAFFAQFGRSPGATLRQDGGGLLIATGVPLPFFNGVMGASLTEGRVEAAIERARAFFREWGMPWLWWVGPTTRPADLAERLRARGFARAFEMPGMAADLRELPEGLSMPQGVSIERVSSPAALSDWLRAAIAAFDFPPRLEPPLLAMERSVGVAPESPYHRFLGRLDGRPVATASLYLGEEVAGLFTIGTVADARRRGIGAAMTLAPLREARERGYRVGILSASRMGEPIYRRIGFREYCRLSTYGLPEGMNDAHA
jgi:GNAT superfamily N-acetyltransferase